MNLELLELETKAFAFVYKRHSGQLYDEPLEVPYTIHLSQVLAVAKEFGIEDHATLISTILHDALEDTRTSYSDLVRLFGEEIAEIVYCVTDELGRNREERHKKTYPKTAQNHKAITVKLCDRIANVRFSLLNSPSMFTKYSSEYSYFRGVLNVFNLNKAQDPIQDALWSELYRLMSPNPS